jgi:lysophospholipase
MWQLIEESELTEKYSTEVAQFWQTKVEFSEFSGEQGISIRYAICEPEAPKGAILFSNGRIETFIKYKAFAYECFQNGIALYMLDHRGQGLSGRMVADSQRGYVGDFQHYVNDLKHFAECVVSPRSQFPPVLVCHSMGSAIGYLTALQSPELFLKAMFCSPMFGVRPAIPDVALNAMLLMGLQTNQWCSTTPWYAFGQGPYIDIPFKINTLTHSNVRYQLFRQEYKQQPSLQLGGVTYQWLAAATDAMNKIEASAAQFPVPTRVLISGADRVVDNNRIHRVVKQIPDAEISVIEGARHELLFESDTYRTPAMTALFDFVVG